MLKYYPIDNILKWIGELGKWIDSEHISVSSMNSNLQKRKKNEKASIGIESGKFNIPSLRDNIKRSNS